MRFVVKDDTEFGNILTAMAAEKQVCEREGRRVIFSDELKERSVAYLENNGMKNGTFAEKTGLSAPSIGTWVRKYGTKGEIPKQADPEPIAKPVPKPAPKPAMIDLDFRGVKFSVRLDQLKTVIDELGVK